MTERVFTDHDLEQMKRVMDPEPENFNKQMMMGIMSRLEAAERCAMVLYNFLDGYQGGLHQEDQQLLENWMKTKGQ